MISPTCQYALRALVHLGCAQESTPVLAREIAAAQDIPGPFLSKILQTLAQHGLVRSQKGPGGGFALGRPPGEILVSEIIVAIDGKENLEKRCLFGRPECNNQVACPLHACWTEIRKRFDETVGALTLQQLTSHEAPLPPA